MAKSKAKIIERFQPAAGGFKRLWIVSHNGQSKVYFDRVQARLAKAELEKA